tara:strand:+ start:128 stop:256 length:129 start_codon:yes stop_codon:yes gene_type:complete
MDLFLSLFTEVGYFFGLRVLVTLRPDRLAADFAAAFPAFVYA